MSGAWPHALLVVDVQQGAFDGLRCPPIDDAAALLERTRSLIAAARAAALPVIFIRHGDEPGAPFEHGSPGHPLHPALQAAPHEPVIDKRACNAFSDTPLAATLQQLGAQHLLVCGLQSEWCVQATTQAALEAGFTVALADDAHGTWPSEGRSSIEIRQAINTTLAAAGADCRSTAQWLQVLGAPVRFDVRRPDGAALVARDLQRHEVPRLQALWDANPHYFQIVNGRNANPGEALEEFEERPPPTMSWREHWMLGLFLSAPSAGSARPAPRGGSSQVAEPHLLESAPRAGHAGASPAGDVKSLAEPALPTSSGPRQGELVGTVIVVSDLVAEGAWHLTLFWLATAEHGSGLAQATYDALEAWVVRQGARWFRLACVVGNTKAERFWERQGFVELKRWKDFDTGGRKNAVRVMLKPLAGNHLEPYLEAVPRDRPAAA